MAKILLLGLCLGIILSPNLCRGQDNILSFYGKAYAKSQSPPDESRLTIVCQQKVNDLFITFIGVEKRKVLLAAITKNRLKDPAKNMFLKVVFARTTPPHPTAGEIVDWGYVFDRNGDGKIDYVVYLFGPLPVKQKDFPADYPKTGQTANFKQYELFIRSSTFVFTHWADDNFDGKVDSVVIEAMDPERELWVDRWILIRSSHFDGTPDEAWYFKDNIQVKVGEAERSDQGFRTQRCKGIDSVFGPENFTKKSETLSILNQAAELCGLTKDSFYRE